MSEPTTREAEVKLSADVDPYVEGVKKASDETVKFTEVVDKLTDKFEKFQKAAGKKLVLFGAGVTAGVVGVTKQAADLEKRMDTLQATAAVTTKSFTGFEREVTTLGKNLPITNRAAIDLVTTLDKLGVTSTKQIGSIADSTTRLSAATGESLQGLTTGMVELGRQMGTVAAGDMSTFANSLLTVSKNAGVSAEGVLGFANAIAGSARAAGMTEQQVLGIASAFSKAGADGYAAASTFTQILSDIQRQIATGSPELAKYANLIGVTSEQFAGMDKGEALIRIFETINAQGSDAIKTLDRLGFDGVRAVREIQKVSQAGGMRQAVALATGAPADNLTKASNAAMDGMADSLTKTGNALERLAQIAGGPFLQAFTPVVDVFGKALGIINQMAGPLSEVAARMTGVLGGGAAVLGGSMLLSRMRSMVTTAGFVAQSSPVQAARGGFEVGRGNAQGRTVVNEAARRAQAAAAYERDLKVWRETGQVGPAPMRPDNVMRWYQRPFYAAAMGAGQAMGPGGGRSMVGPALTSPIRLATWLTQANTEYITNARTSGWNRSAPILGGLGDRSTQLAAMLRHPLAAVRGFDASSWRGPRLDTEGERWASRARGFMEKGQEVPERVAKGLAIAQERAIKSVAANSAATEANTATKRAEIGAGRQLAAASGGLAKAMITMQAQSMATTAAVIGKGAWGATRSIGSGMLGLVGGPWGAAAMGATIGGAALWDRMKETRTSTIDGAAGVDSYRVALGMATEELAGFTGALKEATKNLPKADTWGSVAKISDEVLTLARTPDRKVVNSDVTKFNGSAESLAAWLSSTNFTDPRELQLAQADMVQTSGVATAQRAMDLWSERGGANQSTDFATLLGKITKSQTDSRWDTVLAPLGLGGSGKSREMLGSVYDDIQQRYVRNSRDYNDKYASAVQQNEMLTLLAEATTAESKQGTAQGNLDRETMTRAVSEYEDRMLGGKEIGFYAGSFAKDMEAAGVDLNNTGEKVAYWAKYLADKAPDANNPKTATTAAELDRLKASEESITNQRMRAAGAVGTAFLEDRTVQKAVDRPDDVNAQYQGTMRLLEVAQAAAGGMANSFADIDAQLQSAKAANGDPGSAQWGMLQAAQQMLEVRRQAEMPYMSREQRLGQSAGRYRAVMASDRSAPDFEMRRQGAESELIAAKQQQYDYMKSLVMAHKNYAIQTERAEEDRQIALRQGEEDFQRQMVQGEEDYLRQRDRAQKDFTRQMERHGKDQAKAIYDPMQRVYAYYTTDAATLLQNLEDQNRRIGEQMGNLRKAQSLGLSQESIDTLNLADPQQAQNLARITEDLMAAPELAGKINAQVSGRIKATTELTQSEYNETFQRQKEDWERSRAEQEDDYQRMVERTNDAHQRSLDRMAESWALQMDRSKEDLARMSEEVFGSFTDVMTQATDLIRANLGSLGDTTIAELQRVAGSIPEFTMSQDQFYGQAGSGGWIDPALQKIIEARGGVVTTSGNNQVGRGVRRMMAEGGIATRTIDARVGEAGPEGVIPLNHRGASFLAGMYQEITRQLARDMGTIASPTTYRGGATTIDASTNFTGPITVEAQDPNAMARALKEQARIKKLTRPTVSVAQ